MEWRWEGLEEPQWSPPFTGGSSSGFPQVSLLATEPQWSPLYQQEPSQNECCPVAFTGVPQ
jgi:hypothetical protein